MKDAKSMYLGGDIVEAVSCNFESSRQLGLVCPFCREAVYLRGQTEREVNGRKQIVSPAFCHYSRKLDDLDCERRSITLEGREQIDRIKAEKRGQRLKLYNDRLWEMISSSFIFRDSEYHGTLQECIESAESWAKRSFGSKGFKTIQEDMALSLKRNWKLDELESRIHRSSVPRIEEITILLFEGNREKATCAAIAFSPSEEEATVWVKCLDRSAKTMRSPQKHREIYKEVLGFLASNTSKLVLRQLIGMSIANTFTANAITESSTVSTSNCFNHLLSILYSVSWEAQINKFLASPCDMRVAV